jgi:hypothetical protein
MIYETENFIIQHIKINELECGRAPKSWRIGGRKKQKW